MQPQTVEVMIEGGGLMPAAPAPYKTRLTGMRLKMSFWLPIGMTASFVTLAEAVTSSIGTPEAALVGRLVEGGIVFWCLYHLFTKTFPQIQAAHAKNMEIVCESHEKACETHRVTMETMTDSIRDSATAHREGMEALRREWSDTRNVLVDAVNSQACDSNQDDDSS